MSVARFIEFRLDVVSSDDESVQIFLMFWIMFLLSFCSATRRSQNYILIALEVIRILKFIHSNDFKLLPRLNPRNSSSSENDSDRFIPLIFPFPFMSSSMFISRKKSLSLAWAFPTEKNQLISTTGFAN